MFKSLLILMVSCQHQVIIKNITKMENTKKNTLLNLIEEDKIALKREKSTEKNTDSIKKTDLFFNKNDKNFNVISDDSLIKVSSIKDESNFFNKNDKNHYNCSKLEKRTKSEYNEHEIILREEHKESDFFNKSDEYFC